MDDEHRDEHNHGMPQSANRTQPPQLGAAMHCHCGGCELCQNIGEGSDDTAGNEWVIVASHRVHVGVTDDEESYLGDTYFQGDEGVEGYQFETFEIGSMHGEESLGDLPIDYPFANDDSPRFSGVGTPDSKDVEPPSSNRSLTASMQWHHNSSLANLTAYVGQAFGYYFHDSSVEVSSESLYYPKELSISGSEMDNSDCDMCYNGE